MKILKVMRITICWLNILIIGNTAVAQVDAVGHLDGFKARVKQPIRETERDKKPALGKISGRCVLIAGNGNMFDTPCVNILLVLNDETGKEIVKTRTDKNGEFNFEAPANAKYKISSGSRFIEVVSPTYFLASGSHVNLSLRQK